METVGQACAATERICMLTIRAVNFTEYSSGTLQTLFIISYRKDLYVDHEGSKFHRIFFG